MTLHNASFVILIHADVISIFYEFCEESSSEYIDDSVVKLLFVHFVIKLKK